MIFTETGIGGAWLIEMERLKDERGFFARTWDGKEFEANGLNPNLAQCSISYNRARGRLRGLHYQAAPHEEAKLVRYTAGAIFDVVVDLRAESPTFRGWFGTELSAENRHALYVPVGCAHGFLTLTDDSEVSYQISEPYVPEASRGFAGTTQHSRSPGRSRSSRSMSATRPIRTSSWKASGSLERRRRAFRGGGRHDARLHAGALSNLSEHRRRRSEGDARCGRAPDPADDPRGPERHRGLGLDGARRMEHPGRVCRAGRAAGPRLSRVEPARRELQRARTGGQCRSLRSSTVQLHTCSAARAAGLPRRPAASREGEFEEYHSSADNLDFVRPESLEEALEALIEILAMLEVDRRYVNLMPKGEPQLGKRGLYPTVGGSAAQEEQLAMLWVLNQSDGGRSLLDVAERSGMPFEALRRSAVKLAEAGLLIEVDGDLP